ncbi:MAG: peptidoglycan bridge formation glycyltransferase FemA/FemB family protein [bacterium]|nr:peptidoglycan bridge formation glycyltransferase FemA/FemB family protein [bacterium]
MDIVENETRVVSRHDIRQSTPWQRYMSALGWNVVTVNNAVGYCKHIPLLGSVLKFPRCPSTIDLIHVEKETQHHRAFLVKIEPTTRSSTDLERFKKHGFMPSHQSTMPTSTLQINLTQSIENLWQDVHSSTRTKINRSKKVGLEIVESDDIDAFAKVWSRSARRRGWMLGQSSNMKTLWSSFPPLTRLLLLCKDKTTLLAGVFLLFHDKTAYYMYAFTTDEGRQTPASHMLAWNAMLRSKKHGCVLFDFEGISDDSTPSSWKGFSFFKRGFGGIVVHFPSSLSKTSRWAQYLPTIATM